MFSIPPYLLPVSGDLNWMEVLVASWLAFTKFIVLVSYSSIAEPEIFAAPTLFRAKSTTIPFLIDIPPIV